ncbi:CTP synthase C-terminal region-related (seleno)protein [Nonomuraea sp. CA-143628]|uniref:CTP synthase C-terminal region-related (seleno)protein n=1 Tax=Nonomuraea sp. CA-143628 TaxID=3239997 RepID=UPI003D93983F
MAPSLIVAVVGDFDPTFPTHAATNDALRHGSAELGIEIEIQWQATEALERDLSAVRAADALLCAPGSPYRSLTGAVAALRHGREQGVPTLGTCGGFQHMVIEYARHVLGFEDAQHGEYDPYASELFVSALTCSLAGKTMPVSLVEGSQAAELYGLTEVEEQYYCNFGLEPGHRRTLHDGGFRVTGVDEEQEARVLELPGHPFYVATLFVPQARSTPEQPHPLLTGLLRAALQNH